MSVVVFLAGIAVAFSVLGGWIATQKNRAVEEGMILGFAFGPVGVIVEALLPSMSKADRLAIEAAKREKIHGARRPVVRTQPEPRVSGRRLLGEVHEGPLPPPVPR